jgi:hypothetical protein
VDKEKAATLASFNMMWDQRKIALDLEETSVAILRHVAKISSDRVPTEGRFVASSWWPSGRGSSISMISALSRSPPTK